MQQKVQSDPPAAARLRSPAEPTQAWFGAWDWRHWLFYGGVPSIVAVYAAMNNWAVLQVAGYSGALLFYAGHAFIPWWTTGVVTWLVMRLLRPWRPPQLVVLTLGTVLACLLILPYSQWLTTRFAAGWLPDDPTGAIGSAHIHDQIGVWVFMFRASAIWIAINLLFDRVLGLPRYRYGDAPDRRPPVAGKREAEKDSGSPRFLARLPAAVAADEVIALKAEQHYVQIVTPERKFMTLYRFSDAVAEMDPDAGKRVHRSYWVRTAAIRAVRREARRYSLLLENDMRIPVSAPNRGLIRELARENRIPVYPPH